MKRLSGESREDFVERRKHENLGARLYRRGKMFFTGGTYRKYEPVISEKRVLISPATGKRHRGETVLKFQKRRKVCNATRRQREKERRLAA